MSDLKDDRPYLEKSSLRSWSDVELRDRFFYHPPSSEGAKTHGVLSQEFYELSQVIDALCPHSREKSLAMTHMEQSKMWASAAVARDPKTR